MSRIFLAVVATAALLAAVPAPDEATIVNSGSTNVAGYTISVRSDATASVVASNRGVDATSTPKAFTVDAAVAKQFFADLAAAKSQGAAIKPCMKSASFGSTTRVTWHDWTSPDLSCPPDNAAASALVHDVEVLTAASGAGNALRRGPVMRRAVDLSPNTPEPSPSAS
jgi:hypothetical protein